MFFGEGSNMKEFLASLRKAAVQAQICGFGRRANKVRDFSPAGKSCGDFIDRCGANDLRFRRAER